ncbi:3 beta-hydroxysteroid dehydrogenase type 7 [Ixodes scapularis]|uniref:3 beta-hydroxysteroid dehydrogenase type 7 n=1 Tax=Ixodes scapularis TaxID=6945 RepID=UPI001A9CFED0|nr:3 beta-hydroxysteroid dehydrogenase type 7 [Ixodes scapularis]
MTGGAAECLPLGGRPVTVVLVTGSSGFLGQHVVRLLQEDQSKVREIRLFDARPYKNNLGHRTDKPMREIVGTICDAEAVAQAFSGVECVIHCASLIDVNFFKNVEAMERVNVQGTRNVIEACIAQNVPHLVYTGTVGVDDGTGGWGDSVVEHCHQGPYADTKHRAEQLVLAANARLLADGHSQLRTVVLRVLPIYGEQDQITCTQYMRMSKLTMGTVVRMAAPRMQMSYVGNAAAAHIHAMRRLARDGDISGQVFTVTDDTPTDGLQFMLPFVESRGLAVSRFALPYSVALVFSLLLTSVLTLLRPLYTIKVPFPTPSDIRYIFKAPFFDGTRAKTVLGFEPWFSVEESVRMSMSYYRAIQL